MSVWLSYVIVDRYYGRVIAAEVQKVMQISQTVIDKIQNDASTDNIPRPGVQIEKSLPQIAPPPPPLMAPAPVATLEILGIKVQLSPEDGWTTVAMLLTTVLGTLLGIKIINRLFEK
jgi:hypothetical protein